MSDLALMPTAARPFDIVLAHGALATDDGLRTAIVVSLFSDARARADDALPQAGADRRGWWGDLGNDDPDDRLGSRLWLLAREKLVAGTADRARDLVREALDWLIQDNVVSDIGISVELLPVTAQRRSGGLAIGVQLARPDGPARQRYDFVWTATAEALA